jgi:hypothetical protein
MTGDKEATMKKFVRSKVLFMVVFTGLIVLPFSSLVFAKNSKKKVNSSEHKYGQFRELCGLVGEKDFCGNQLIESETNTIPISMQMRAGAQGYEPWPESFFTIHNGVGYIEPFGAATYSCGVGYPEQDMADKPAFMDDISWSDPDDDGMPYDTGLFCVYEMEDGSGSIWAYDGVMGNLKPPGFNGLEGNKMDQLLNVVVGGTGVYEGATGIWVGHTEGWGEMSNPEGAPPWLNLPKTIFKILNGYIQLQPVESAD